MNNETNSLESIGLRLVVDHINRVQKHMVTAVANLTNRLVNHDQSKLGEILDTPQNI